MSGPCILSSFTEQVILSYFFIPITRRYSYNEHTHNNETLLIYKTLEKLFTKRKAFLRHRPHKTYRKKYQQCTCHNFCATTGCIPYIVASRYRCHPHQTPHCMLGKCSHPAFAACCHPAFAACCHPSVAFSLHMALSSFGKHPWQLSCSNVMTAQVMRMKLACMIWARDNFCLWCYQTE